MTPLQRQCFTGGCMCKAVRYECSAAPIAMGNCHCRDCQRATGTAFSTVILVPHHAVKITGEIRYYDVTSGSGSIVSRGFCPICGSRLLSQSSSFDLISITAGSLDDPSWFQPAVDFYTASAQPWDYMNPDLPKFPQLPPPPNNSGF